MEGELDVVGRALRTAGRSSTALYALVRRQLEERVAGGRLIDFGCGRGDLRPFVADRVDEYVGVDVVRYDGFPSEAEFFTVDLGSGCAPLPAGSADAVVSVETIEHVENPRAFFRELVRLARPGGWIFVTTPNQTSFLSLLTLVFKGHFVSFLDSSYPVHLTALLPTDLLRIAHENGLEEATLRYSEVGRVPGSASHFPRLVSRAWPSRFSDNVLLMGRKSLTPRADGSSWPSPPVASPITPAGHSPRS